MSITSWVCAQIQSKSDCFRQGLGLLAISGKETVVATKYAELNFFMGGLGFVFFFFLVPFCFGDSLRGQGLERKTGMELSS